MSNRNDDKVRDLLERYEEPFNADTTWKIQGTPVIYHAVLERIAVRAGIKFGEPKIIRAERDECVLLVNAWLLDGDGQITDDVWTFGEALVGSNYKVSGKQAAYPHCMAEKRGRGRAILKLLGITDEALDETSAREKEADERWRKNLKARLCAALGKRAGSAVEEWEKLPAVQDALASLAEVDRLDIERLIDERRDL